MGEEGVDEVAGCRREEKSEVGERKDPSDMHVRHSLSSQHFLSSKPVRDECDDDEIAKPPYRIRILVMKSAHIHHHT